MLSPSLVHQYWEDVERYLREHHGLSAHQAKTKSRQYRDWLASEGVSDTVYNRDPKRSAAAALKLNRDGE
jgi:hypothetical protein